MGGQEDKPTSDKSPLASSFCQAGNPPLPSSSSPTLLLPLPCCMAVHPFPLRLIWKGKDGILTVEEQICTCMKKTQKKILPSEKERRSFIGQSFVE